MSLHSEARLGRLMHSTCTPHGTNSDTANKHTTISNPKRENTKARGRTTTHFAAQLFKQMLVTYNTHLHIETATGASNEPAMSMQSFSCGSGGRHVGLNKKMGNGMGQGMDKDMSQDIGGPARDMDKDMWPEIRVWVRICRREYRVWIRIWGRE